MILGIGNDLVDMRRIEKILADHGMHFEQRSFSAYEQEKANVRKARSVNPNAQAEYYAKRFAAKEAGAKALGTGFRDGIYLKDISVEEDKTGRPFLHMHGGAREQLQKITPPGHEAVLHLTLSDEPPYAQAFVIIEARPIIS